MKVGKLKKGTRYDVRIDRSLNIQTYGENNDYPQQVIKIVQASATGASCVNVYSKFIRGRGFSCEDFHKKTINKKGQTAGYILKITSVDYATQGGFAIHLNYNANYDVISVQHIPIETVRFERLNELREFNKVAIHPDWSREQTQLFAFDKEDVVFLDLFNSDPSVIKEQVEAAGGWNNYKGQVYYYSNNGDKTYPTPIFDSVLTDMNTEEGISNVSNRNARNNYFTAGMLVDVINDDESEDQENETEKAILDFQSDEEACNIMYIKVKSEEEKPIFESFSGTNYDKQFTVTEVSTKDRIGRTFIQPPILRAENVGANFGADLMINAYKFYNSVVEDERMDIERVFTQIFEKWHEPIENNFSITPLSYNLQITLAERLGDKGFEQLIKIIENIQLSIQHKRNMAKRMFDLEDEELNDLIPEI